MDKKKANKLITKLIENRISEKESELLINWLKEGNNLKYFDQLIEVNHLVNLTQKFETKNSFKNVLNKVTIKSRNTYQQFFKYAAIFVILLTTGYYLINNQLPRKTEIEISNNINIGTDKAVLTLEDGTNVELEKGKEFKTEKISSDGKKITYQTKNGANVEKITYNYLTIPRGGEFFMVLADETKVWLNSESQLKYPVTFIKGQTREVELIYGEAYFEVSPSTEHSGSKFKVNHKMQVVEVLGTEFNIKAYKEETEIYTTLVEGKVNVGINAVSRKLNPGQQSKFSLDDEKIEIIEVDVLSETSWKNGMFNFKRQRLKEIEKVLSRWYDVEIVFENESLGNVYFTGALSKNQKIEKILKLFKNTNFINDFEITQKKIIIK